jgi:ElaB/YqjD/DUF883 family membrane-anchored ribosome-binding protein
MNATLATATAGNGAGRAKETVGTHFEELFDGVDDLIKRVADVENPEIRKIRARVHFALVAAKGAFDDGATQLPPRAAQVRPEAAQAAEAHFVDCTDGDIHDTGPALGVAALLLGLGLGLIASLRQ